MFNELKSCGVRFLFYHLERKTPGFSRGECQLYCMAVQYEAIDEETDMIKDVADELNALGIAEDTTGIQTIN